MSAAPPNGRTWSVTLATVGVLTHAGLTLAIVVLYLGYVMAAKRTFDEFGLMLPWATQTVFRFGNSVAEYWWLLVFAAPLLAAIDFVTTAVIDARSRFVAVMWTATVALALTTVVAVTVFAIELPRAKLKEGLAR